MGGRGRVGRIWVRSPRFAVERRRKKMMMIVLVIPLCHEHHRGYALVWEWAFVVSVVLIVKVTPLASLFWFGWWWYFICVIFVVIIVIMVIVVCFSSLVGGLIVWCFFVFMVYF